MSQPNNEQTNDTTNTPDPDYVPHDPGGDDFSSMEIESESGVDEDNSGGDDNSGSDDDDSDDHSTAEDDSDADNDDSGDDVDKSGVFVYDDKSFNPETRATETETEKAQRLQILELQQQLAQNKPAGSEPQPELTEPGFYDAGIDGDPEKYAAAMKAYGIEAGKREAAQLVEQQKQEQRRQQEATIYETNVKNYDARRVAVKATLPDIDEADVMLAQSLPDMHQAAIMAAGLENPEMVVYALYKNKDLREKLSAETNPIRLGVMLADISKKSRLAPEGKKPKINKAPEVKGSQGSNPKGNGLSKEFASAKFE